MDDDYDTEEPVDPSYYDERSRAVQRAMALVEVWRRAPPGSIWRERVWLRPEWRPGVLH
jgi:hypothetical protein